MKLNEMLPKYGFRVQLLNLECDPSLGMNLQFLGWGEVRENASRY
jgi:hypothetical protein